MKEIIVKAYAKINLSIDVLGKRPDGYHEVLMVMEQVDLYDLVKVTWVDGADGIQIDLSANLSFLPVDNRNIAYKAAELMIKQYGSEKTGCIMIELVKSIPVAAGLAGGSSNCAAVLHALNNLWELGLNVDTLMKLGSALGADVPFCIAGQAALNENLGLSGDKMAGTCAVASGIGDKLELINPLKAWVLLSKPSISVSTAQVYGGLNLNEITERPNTPELVSGLREENFYKISKNMTNVLESYSLT
ncbi:MAG: 4-(cytidine 5'-diphospho)-2-C-methyl-D-erythritol kinase, partial [Bacillota bacterium]